ncbi:MAG: futalosine hydrolase [Bacteroidales bacterium]
MALRVLIVTATPEEADAFNRIVGLKYSPEGVTYRNCTIALLVTGVGAAATAWSLTKWFSVNEHPDVAINIGIAGSFRDDICTGDVVMPVSDCFADAGIETSRGFLTLAESGLEALQGSLFAGGLITSENRFTDAGGRIVRKVNAITVNTVTGTADSIKRLTDKFNPDIETMEGATFFYICSREEVPFISMRAVSNIIEPRKRDKWNISLAIGKLSEKLEEFLTTLE